MRIRSLLRRPTRDRIPSSTGPNPQDVSPLFNKLPAELRQQIYEHALGDMDNYIRILHLGGAQFTYVRCAPADADSYTGDVQDLKDNERKRRHLLALPRSCKRIYAEAASTLYTHNAFFFSLNMACADRRFCLWTQKLGQPGLDRLRHLHFSAMFVSQRRLGARVHASDTLAEWNETCHVLETLSTLGLHRLRLTLRAELPVVPPAGDAWFVDVLFPLLGVQVQEFEIVMGFPVPESVVERFGGAMPWRMVVDRSVQVWRKHADRRRRGDGDVQFVGAAGENGI